MSECFKPTSILDCAVCNDEKGGCHSPLLTEAKLNKSFEDCVEDCSKCYQKYYCDTIPISTNNYMVDNKTRAIKPEYIPKIEEALKIKLYTKQIKFLLTGDYSVWDDSRQQGITTAKMIRMALSYDYGDLYINNFRNYTDRDSNETLYSDWFRNTFMELRQKLKNGGFDVIRVLNARGFEL